MSCIMPRQSPERISHYRQKASDARSCAEQMQEGKDLDTMLDVASTWERLADLEETALPLAQIRARELLPAITLVYSSSGMP
jgi:hypothetical protein